MSWAVARSSGGGERLYWQGHPGAEFGDQQHFVAAADCSRYDDRAEAQRIAAVLAKRLVNSPATFAAEEL